VRLGSPSAGKAEGSGDCPVPLDLDPFDEAVLADPFPAARQLREAGPVALLEPYRCLAVARYDVVRQVLRDHQTFSSARGVGIEDASAPGYWRRPSLLLEVDPPLHERTRGAVARTLTPKALAGLEEVFRQEAERLVDDLVDQGEIDGVTDLAEVFPTTVFPRAFGLRGECREPLLRYGAMVFNGHGPRNRLWHQSMEGSEEVVAWVTEHCRRDALAPGSIGAAVYEAVDRGEVDEDEAGLLVRSFLSAGVDTTVSALAFALLDLAREPSAWAAVRADPSLARAAFEEVVRLESPVVQFFRTTTRAVELAGCRIPEGSKVLVSYAGANRDPDRFEQPDEFQVTRRAAGHLGYGTGIHNCVGQVVARMEGAALLGALARRVARIEQCGSAVPRLNNTLRGLDRLPLRLVPA